MYHNLPVFYAWDFDAQHDDRYSRLNPDLIALWEEDDPRLLGGSSSALGGELAKAAARSWDFDNYLTELTFDTTGSLSSYDSNAKHMVIDFEGWGRRPIHSDQAPSYAAQFHFTTTTDEASGDSIIIFF